MIHPHTELRHISPEVGYGVFATRDIPAGTITYVQDTLEIVVTPENFVTHAPEMQAAIEKYSFIDERGNRIVSWDFAKYVNHCCACNTMSTGYGFEIALRDIAAGEQLTDEYGIFNLEEEMPLVCKYGQCRGRVCPNDFDVYYERWDQQILAVMPKLSQVAQPLLPLLAADTRAALEAYRGDPAQYRSVYRLRYRPVNVIQPAAPSTSDPADLPTI